MNAICNHEAYAVENLDDKTAWLALVDHHHEALNVPYRVALKAVARMRRLARQDREIERAKQEIQSGGRFARQICDAVRAYCADDYAMYGTVVIKPGRGRPKLSLPAVTTNPTASNSVYVIVGARFIIKLARLAEEVRAIENEAFANVSTYLFDF